MATGGGFPIRDYTGLRLTTFGDSKTVGLYSNNPPGNWATQLAAATGMTLNNKGLSSSTLQKRSPVDVFGATNMVDRVSEIPVYDPEVDGLMTFEYGANDWGCNRPNYTVANFITDYKTVIDAARVLGWPTKRILIMSPTWPTDTAFNWYYSLPSGMPAPNRATYRQYVAACEQVAHAKGTLYFNLSGAMEAGSPASYVRGDDGVHLTDAGNTFVASVVTGYLQGN
jgi:lysophospholipase L1-like esterase